MEPLSTLLLPEQFLTPYRASNCTSLCLGRGWKGEKTLDTKHKSEIECIGNKILHAFRKEK